MDEGIEVGRLAQISRVEMKRSRRIVGGQFQFATRHRPNDSRGGRVTIRRNFQGWKRRCVTHKKRLMIGDRKPGIAFGKKVSFKDVVVWRWNLPTGLMNHKS